MQTVKDQWLPGVHGKGGINRAERIWGSESLLYEIIMVDTWHYAFVQTHRMYNTKSETM